MTKIFLGIDGGGTGTRAVLADESGRLLGIGRAGGTNYNNAAASEVVENLGLAVRRAFEAAGVALDAGGCSFFGMSAVRGREDEEALHDLISRAGLVVGGRSVHLANDLFNALAGGLALRPGIALIAGTGSNCLGRDASGASFMCGGWGRLLDDAGSGYWIGLRGLQVAVRSFDGRCKTTSLLPAALAFLEIDDATSISHRVYMRGLSTTEIAAFAPSVIAAARQGDAVARAILSDAADELAAMVKGIAGKLDFGGAPEVVLLGGVASSGPPLQRMIEDAIQREVPGARRSDAEFSPAIGAVINALDRGGATVTASVLERLKDDAGKYAGSELH